MSKRPPPEHDAIPLPRARAMIHRYLFTEGVFARIAGRDLSTPPADVITIEKLRETANVDTIDLWTAYADAASQAAIDQFACGVDCAAYTFSMGHAAMAGAQSRGLDMKAIVPLRPPQAPKSIDLVSITRETEIAKTRNRWLDFEPRLLRLLSALTSGKDIQP